MATAVAEYSGEGAAVFLLAENRLLREALLRVLSKKEDIRVVGSGPDGPNAVTQIIASGANIVVLDSISRILGEQSLLPELRRQKPLLNVVMVGMDADAVVFLRIVQAGVLGYVLKDASALDVARTIRAVALGEAVCPAALSAALFQWVARNKPTLPNLHLKNALGLSRREQQLVGPLQQGLTNKEIANRLNLSEQTVKNHVHRMLRKLGAPDRLSIVEACRNEGLNL